VLDYDWVLHIRQQCVDHNIPFQFRQCGTHFHKDGKLYTLGVKQLVSQARKAGVDIDECGDDYIFSRKRNLNQY
jgi:hypothetical protein